MLRYKTSSAASVSVAFAQLLRIFILLETYNPFSTALQQQHIMLHLDMLEFVCASACFRKCAFAQSDCRACTLNI